MIVSCAVNSMKPEAAFYQALLDRSGVAASKILFIDDLGINIEGARAAGMVGHLFTSRMALETVLAELQII